MAKVRQSAAFVSIQAHNLCRKLAPHKRPFQNVCPPLQRCLGSWQSLLVWQYHLQASCPHTQGTLLGGELRMESGSWERKILTWQALPHQPPEAVDEAPSWCVGSAGQEPAGDSSPLLHGVCEEPALQCAEGLEALHWSSRPHVFRRMLAGPQLRRGRNPSTRPLHGMVWASSRHTEAGFPSGASRRKCAQSFRAPLSIDRALTKVCSRSKGWTIHLAPQREPQVHVVKTLWEGRN
ncbi:uncharacterized protein [Kogia breviceps]|uniref:uncharacterized protein n=1 Tax=Kogia breviceps TaxID=27615 RepID=UPI0034D2E970